VLSDKGPLKCLFITNFAPPLNAGGYDQLCWEVASGLRDRGHRVVLLTSDYQSKNAPPGEKDIHRELKLERNPYLASPPGDRFSRKRRQALNLEVLMRHMMKIQPDAVILWSLWVLSKSVAAMVENLAPERTAYYLAGFWPVDGAQGLSPTRSPGKSRLKAFIRRSRSRLVGRWQEDESQPELQFEHVMCVSAALRDALVEKGLPVAHAKIVYNGIDVDQFARKSSQDPDWHDRQGLKLLYAGQIARHKGVHTAVEAIDQLVKHANICDVHLTIVGSGSPEYLDFLRKLVRERGLGENVDFHDRVDRERMPDLMREFDVLVLPSIYDEPLARIAMEGMAAGLVVISTLTGGMKELIIDGENGLAFSPEDAGGLARQIERVHRDRSLAENLIRSARKTVEERFDIERMVDEFESFLYEMVRTTDS